MIAGAGGEQAPGGLSTAVRGGGGFAAVPVHFSGNEYYGGDDEDSDEQGLGVCRV